MLGLNYYLEVVDHYHLCLEASVLERLSTASEVLFDTDR